MFVNKSVNMCKFDLTIYNIIFYVYYLFKIENGLCKFVTRFI